MQGFSLRGISVNVFFKHRFLGSHWESIFVVGLKRQDQLSDFLSDPAPADLVATTAISDVDGNEEAVAVLSLVQRSHSLGNRM